MNGLETLVCLSHRVFISGAQAAGGGGGVHPTVGNREEFKTAVGGAEGREENTQALPHFNM